MSNHNERSMVLLLIIIMAGGAFLRFYKIGTKGLWLDEVFTRSDLVKTVDASVLPRGTILSPRAIFSEDNAARRFRNIWSHRAWEPHPPLYFLFLKVWTHGFGYDDAALRSLSAFFSILTIFAGFLIVRYLTNAQTGLLMAILLATSPLNIYFAQEGRSYALLLFFLLMSFYSLLRLQQEPGRFYGVGYALFLCAAFYTHYLAFLGFLSQVLYVALQKDRTFRGQWLKAVGWAGLLYLPWLPKLFAQRTPIGTFAANSWMLDEHSRWLWILRAGVLPMESIFSSGFYQITSSAGLHPWFFVQGAVLLVCLYRVKQTHPSAFAILALWLFVPVVVFLMLDITLGANFLKFTRFTFMINPATYIILALTLGSLRARYRVMALIIVVIVNFMIAARYYKEPYKISDYKNAARTLETKLPKGDLVVLYNPNGEPWRTSTLLLCLGHYFPFRDHPFLLAETDRVSDGILVEINRFERVAFIGVEGAPFPSRLLSQYSVKEESHFANLGTVALLIRHTAGLKSLP